MEVDVFPRTNVHHKCTVCWAVFFGSDLLATNDATFLCAQVDIPASHSLPSPQHSGSEHKVPSIPGQDPFIIIIIIVKVVTIFFLFDKDPHYIYEIASLCIA